MKRMRHATGIKMSSRIAKSPTAAVSSLVDMQRKKTCLGLRQAPDLGADQDTVLSLAKTHRTPNPKGLFFPPDMRHGAAHMISYQQNITLGSICTKSQSI